MMCVYLQILTIIFAFCSGRHDVPAVDNFTFHGSNRKDQFVFHWSNWFMKFCYVLGISVAIAKDDWYHPILLGISNMLIIWAVFDPTVAIFRKIYTPPKKPWYYLSKQGNIIDRTMRDLFGEKAGLYKFWFCVAAIIYCNHLML